MRDTSTRPLFIFEMANNHMGSVEHGLRIVRAIREAAEGFPFLFAVKMQYREIQSCIHPDYRARYDLKFVKRFSETSLSWEQLKRLKDEIVACGFLAICTPWDEVSVDRIEEHGFHFLKVPSCYLTDWPLIERIGASTLPVIASTAGATLENVDRVVSFFEHRRRPLHLMHCVGEYPTGEDRLELNQIDLLKARYPRHEVGYSTHEDPSNLSAVQIALAKGATIFERHVGVPTEEYPLNAYSSTPEQVRAWLEAAQAALRMCGMADDRYVPCDAEVRTLRDLQRGVFARAPIAAGERVDPSRVFYAMPCAPGQLVASDMSKYTEFVALQPIGVNEPVMEEHTRRIERRERLLGVVGRVKALLKESGVVVPGQLELEVSHHYGLDRFDQFGSTVITVVNREYCKRIIVLLPGQTHPEQYHQRKDETYHILYGKMTLTLDGQTRTCGVNDVIEIPRGVRHALTTDTGVVIEEISSAYSQQDSFYVDDEIHRNPSRKTYITYWMD